MFDEKNVTLVYKSTMENNNPLSPHLQIYKWQISSLLSITHRIVGVINFFAIVLICFWAVLLVFGQSNYSNINIILVYKLKMENNNPLSPHLQIYKWQISSLLSITHRIVGVINFFAIILICVWAIFIIFGQNNYSAVNFFLNTSFGKFIIISLCWTFSFHILNELRHLVWDAGYGFDLKVAKITGMIAFIGSFVLTILFYILGRNFF